MLPSSLRQRSLPSSLMALPLTSQCRTSSCCRLSPRLTTRTCTQAGEVHRLLSPGTCTLRSASAFSSRRARREAAPAMMSIRSPMPEQGPTRGPVERRPARSSSPRSRSCLAAACSCGPTRFPRRESSCCTVAKAAALRTSTRTLALSRRVGPEAVRGGRRDRPKGRDCLDSATGRSRVSRFRHGGQGTTLRQERRRAP